MSTSRSFGLILSFIVALSSTIPASSYAIGTSASDSEKGGPDYTTIAGDKKEAAWFYSVVSNGFAGWRTALGTLLTGCPIPLSELDRIANYVSGLKTDAAGKINSMLSEEFTPLHPDDAKPASCGQAAYCTCYLVGKIFKDSSCEIESGKSADGKGHAFAAAKIKGIDGTVNIDGLNAIAIVTK